MLNEHIARYIKTRPVYYYCVFLSLIGYFLYLSVTRLQWQTSLLFIMTGLFIWSLNEYLLHRFVFHFHSPKRFMQLIHYVLHGIHHAHPRDASASITPFVISLPLAFFFYYIFKLIFPDTYVAVFSGFLSGYVLYTIIHDSTHHFPMNFPFLRTLKKNHMYHHYFENHGNFGVSTPFWDYVFGTHKKKDK